MTNEMIQGVVLCTTIPGISEALQAENEKQMKLGKKISKTMNDDPAMKRLYETLFGHWKDSEDDEDEEVEEKEKEKVEEAKPVVKTPKPRKKRTVVEDLSPKKMDIAKGILISDWSLLQGDLKRAAARVCYRGGFTLFKNTDAPKVIRLIRQMRRQYNVKRIPGTGSWTSPS